MSSSLEYIGFDKIYCINLLEREDRKDNVEKQFSEIGLNNYELFPAINAKKLGLKSEVKQIARPKENLTAGMIGCYLSHYFIFQEAVQKNWNSFCVFEDDLILVPKFNYFLDIAMESLPKDWEFIYLGYTEYQQWMNNAQIKKYLDKQQVSESWVVPVNGWGTQSYAVRGKETINKIYNELHTMKAQIDEQLNQFILPNSSIKYYSAFPSLVNQGDFGTDVQSK